MYNQALQYIEQNNADLAIIELKKAINQAPNYIKAYQLLGLLYFERQQYAAARKVFLQALKVDRNNITTLRYMEQLQKVAGRKGIKTKSIKNSEFTESVIQIRWLLRKAAIILTRILIRGCSPLSM